MGVIIIDDREVAFHQGQMLIDVADAAGIEIPRFCYHPKLSVAANCRMCLVEVQGAKKPAPACATPVAEGMIVRTRSATTRKAQKSVMEFLLINHPLDCPICDQGGECELQDVSLEYGKDVSRYTQGKRVIVAKNIGPLIHTDLTRCIHCTRCVRFGKEIAGIHELGMVGRGEHSEIETFIAKSVDSELSGNMIDICPVGALTSKPFRYSARAWELNSRPGIGAHDSSGSHLFYHIKDNIIKRVVPRSNESINEVWLSDRDRFSYQGLYADTRYSEPRVRSGGKWRPERWQDALEKSAKILSTTKADALASECCSVEELYLLKQLVAGLGGNMDTRLRQLDRAANAADIMPPLDECEGYERAFVVGSNIAGEHPMLAHRLRKGGTELYCLNPCEYDFRIRSEQVVVRPSLWIDHLAEMVKAALQLCKKYHRIDALNLSAIACSHSVKLQVSRLIKQRSVVLLGQFAQQHPRYSELLGWSRLLAEVCNIPCYSVAAQANTVGAYLLNCQHPKGIMPLLADCDKALIVVNFQPEYDTLFHAALEQRMQKSPIIYIGSYYSAMIEEYADVILPIAAHAETAGTFVSMSGLWQSFQAAVSPPREVQPAWKVLRVLGNALKMENFEYKSCADVCVAARQFASATLESEHPLPLAFEPRQQLYGLDGVAYWHPYAGDCVLRSASALQQTRLAQSGRLLFLNREDSKHHLIRDEAVLHQRDRQVAVGANADDRVAAGACLLPAVETAPFCSDDRLTIGKEAVHFRY